MSLINSNFNVLINFFLSYPLKHNKHYVYPTGCDVRDVALECDNTKRVCLLLARFSVVFTVL